MKITLYLKNINIDHDEFVKEVEKILGSLNGVTIIKDTMIVAIDQFIVDSDQDKYNKFKQLKETFLLSGKHMSIEQV